MNPGCRVQDQLNTSEPTASYIIGLELHLWKLPDRQWESNPQPSEQLRPMTIKTSASTETATTKFGKCLFSVFGSTAWKNLPETKSSSTLDVFKNRLKCHFVNL